jgi:hypothetical protein
MFINIIPQGPKYLNNVTMTTIITSPAWQNADLKNELQPSTPTVPTLVYYTDRPGWISGMKL